MNSSNNLAVGQFLEEFEDCTQERIRENLYVRMIGAIREAGVRSFEWQSAKLQYRNLETSIRLGLL